MHKRKVTISIIGLTVTQNKIKWEEKITESAKKSGISNALNYLIVRARYCNNPDFDDPEPYLRLSVVLL